jgi:hypothetical protein
LKDKGRFMPGLKLNLGCGQRRMEGFLNVDKFGEPDLCFDLETFPWPWEDSSVDTIVLNHVLEHLGQSPDVYFGIMKELYRICQPEALLHINVPHPRHDDFITDPTHVRVVTPDSLGLFSKANNLEWKRLGAANSPLGLYLDVDFEVLSTSFILDAPWQEQRQAGVLSDEQVFLAIRQYNNVVKEIHMQVKVVK